MAESNADTYLKHNTALMDEIRHYYAWVRQKIQEPTISNGQRIAYQKMAAILENRFHVEYLTLNNELMNEKFAFSQLANREVNTLIFPNLSAGNIAYKLLQEMTDSDAIGPILVGLKKSVHVLQMGSSVREIVNMVKVAVVDAQTK